MVRKYYHRQHCHIASNATHDTTHHPPSCGFGSFGAADANDRHTAHEVLLRHCIIRQPGRLAETSRYPTGSCIVPKPRCRLPWPALTSQANGHASLVPGDLCACEERVWRVGKRGWLRQQANKA